jgi:hypothetical protein
MRFGSVHTACHRDLDAMVIAGERFACVNELPADSPAFQCGIYRECCDAANVAILMKERADFEAQKACKTFAGVGNEDLRESRPSDEVDPASNEFLGDRIPKMPK